MELQRSQANQGRSDILINFLIAMNGYYYTTLNLPCCHEGSATMFGLVYVILMHARIQGLPTERLIAMR